MIKYNDMNKKPQFIMGVCFLNKPIFNKGRITYSFFGSVFKNNSCFYNLQEKNHVVKFPVISSSNKFHNTKFIKKIGMKFFVNKQEFSVLKKSNHILNITSNFLENTNDFGSGGVNSDIYLNHIHSSSEITFGAVSSEILGKKIKDIR